MQNNLAEVYIAKQEDTIARLENLIAGYEVSFQRDFLQVVNAIKSDVILNEIADLLEAGNIQQAAEVIERGLIQFSDVVVTATVASGQDTADFINNALGVFVSFDQTNTNAVNQMRDSRLRLITELTQAQRDAIRESLVDGIRRGLNPRQQARNVVQAIGLTRRQVQAVNNFRRLIESGSSQALNRTLRDRRFDRTIQRAIRGEALTDEQVNRIVDRYAERQLRYRSEVIARTEALRAVHQGNNLMYSQAVEEGVLDITRLTQTWHTANDDRVRETHNGMNNQIQPFGTPFVSDAGNLLRYPGDPDAPADETIQCRCVLTTRLSPLGDQ